MRSLLGLSETEPDPASEVESIRRIGEALEKMDPAEAKRLACFAFVLARVARADLNISPEETRAMERIVGEQGGVPEAQAALIVEVAKAQNQLVGTVDDYLVTRKYRESATLEQRKSLLHCVLAVSAADDSISAQEDAEIRKVAAELGFDHTDFIAARTAFRDKLEVLKLRR